MASAVWIGPAVCTGSAVLSLTHEKQQQRGVGTSVHSLYPYIQCEPDRNLNVVNCSIRGRHRVQQFSCEVFPSHGVNVFSSEISAVRSARAVNSPIEAGRALASSVLSARELAPRCLLRTEPRNLSWSRGFVPGDASARALRHACSGIASASWLTPYIVKAAAKVQGSAAESRPTSGVAVYKPASYDVLVADAARAVIYALDDKKQRLEVDFPPLPSSVSGYKGSSDEFIDANIQLSFALARKLNEAKGLSSKIVFPDGPEKRRGLRGFKSALQLTNCVSFGSLDDLPAAVKGPARGILGSIKGFFDFDFEEDNTENNGSTADVYIMIGASTNELPAVKEYIDYFAKNSPVILFNLETDTLRSDLGLFGFPSKDVHYKFLSYFQPVFYVRTRDYSKSVPVAPFILNYSGALFRQYPGPWQVMLKQVDGSYACVSEGQQRYTLFQTKEELLTSLGLQEEQGSTMAFLRSGYKTSTWWEDTLEPEESEAWRT